VRGGGEDQRSGTESHTVAVEADSEAAAIEKVRQALENRGAVGEFHIV
jgi:ribosomal protein L20A (L18A)